MRAVRIALMLPAVLGLFACARPDSKARLDRVAADGKRLEAEIDDLEARLLASKARVRFWQDWKAELEGVATRAIRDPSLVKEDPSFRARRVPNLSKPIPSRDLSEQRLASLKIGGAPLPKKAPAFEATR